FIDSTSIAMLMPSLVLIGLVGAAAHKKRMFCWQGVGYAPATSLLNGLLRHISVGFLAMASGIAILSFCNTHSIWDPVFGVGSHGVPITMTSPAAAAWSQFLDVCLSVVCILPLAYVLNTLIYGRSDPVRLKGTDLASGPIFSALFICWCL